MRTVPTPVAVSPISSIVYSSPFPFPLSFTAEILYFTVFLDQMSPTCAQRNGGVLVVCWGDGITLARMKSKVAGSGAFEGGSSFNEEVEDVRRSSGVASSSPPGVESCRVIADLTSVARRAGGLISSSRIGPIATSFARWRGERFDREPGTVNVVFIFVAQIMQSPPVLTAVLSVCSKHNVVFRVHFGFAHGA